MKFPPASMNASMIANASSSFVSLPKYIVPSAILETTVPDRPSLVYCMTIIASSQGFPPAGGRLSAPLRGVPDALAPRAPRD